MGKLSGQSHAGHLSGADHASRRRHAHNYYVLGRRKAEEGAFDAACELLRRALELDPLLVPALQALVTLELSREQLADARAYAERAVSIDPDDPDSLSLLGNVALSERHPEQALEAFTRARELGGDSLELRFNMGIAHLFLAQAEDAGVLFQGIVEEQPGHQRAWDALGCARRLLKNYAGASEAFMQALHVDPQMNEARDHLAQLLLETGDAPRAQKVLVAALSLDPQRASSRHLLGMAYAAEQDYPSAAVAKYLPKSVKMPTRNGKEITLLQLATHTSGLPDGPDNLDPKRADNPYADYTVEKMYAFVSGYKLTRDPGTKYEYSTVGMALLGQAIALKAGTNYESLVVDRICRPLKMDSTRITLTPELKSRFAQGHNYSDTRYRIWIMEL